MLKPAHFPAEWVPQDAILLVFPHSGTDWASFLPHIEKTYQELIAAITAFEPVLLACHNEAVKQQAEKLLSGQNSAYPVFYAVCQADDTWVRDFGPIGVYDNGKACLLDFTFNGWGNKYPHHFDNLVTNELVRKGFFSRNNHQVVNFILEGGSIETDGLGTLLTTRSCLLNPNRTHQDQHDVEKTLATYLGITHFLWLNHGQLIGDDTDGHIDTLARFVDPETICYVSCDDPEDEHYTSLKKMEQELQQFRTAAGKRYRLLPLPLPQAKYSTITQKRLPATYANFLIINNAVIVPTYGDPNDTIALRQLTIAFPTRKIVPVNALTIIEQGGSIHCLSMQLPQGTLIQS